MTNTFYILMHKNTFDNVISTLDRHKLKRLVTVPTEDWLKNDIKDWLDNYNIPYSSSDLKSTLISVAEEAGITEDYSPTWAEWCAHKRHRYPIRYITYNDIDYVIWADSISALAGELSTFYALGEGLTDDYTLLTQQEALAWIAEHEQHEQFEQITE